jgi:MEMO1 family protein
MGSLDRPKLRPLSAQRVEHDGRPFAALEDPLGAFSDTVLIPLEGFHRVVRHFDGTS